jgi:hypothetical protein
VNDYVMAALQEERRDLAVATADVEYKHRSIPDLGKQRCEQVRLVREQPRADRAAEPAVSILIRACFDVGCFGVMRPAASQLDGLGIQRGRPGCTLGGGAVGAGEGKRIAHIDSRDAVL